MKQATPIVAIVVVGALEAYAISQGINGVLLSGAFILIAGLGGYSAKAARDKSAEKKNKGG